MLQHNNAKSYAARIYTLCMQMVVTSETDSPASFMWGTKGTQVQWSNTEFLNKTEMIFWCIKIFISYVLFSWLCVWGDTKLLINLAVLNDSEWILIPIRTAYMTALEKLRLRCCTWTASQVTWKQKEVSKEHQKNTCLCKISVKWA